ncbi:MAG TPA: hypothetical protein VNV66_05685 [Pilimelia sp.]|nr:hypothetical protein [Pilimelia sp.]
MRIYADRPAVALRQLLTDLLVLAWVYAWVRAAMWLHDLVQGFAAPGRQVETAGAGMADNLAAAGGRVGRLPIVGDELTAPFHRAAEAARALADAGRAQQEAVADAALALSLGIAALPLAVVLLGWLPWRLRWMRRAGAAAALREAPAGRELLALRALAGQPLRRLSALGPDLVGRWRAGDPATVEALAGLELQTLGLRPRP